MFKMATVTAPKLQAIEPDQVVLHEISWGMYCQLREEEANHSVRMTYLDGDLLLISPEMRHDHPVELLGLLIRGVTAGLGQEIMGIRTTTLRLVADPGQKKGAGKEADAAYYLGDNERRMRRREDLDLHVDPPPDLAIEVENSRSVTAVAMTVSARLRVPEVWRYRLADRSIIICCLDASTGGYVVADQSRALPRLTPALILAALDRYEVGDLGENGWFEWVKDWARKLPELGVGGG